MLESEIKSHCRDELEKHGWLTVHIMSCNKNGWPDTQIFKNGRTVFIEFKRPGQEVDPEGLQAYRHKLIREQGFEVIVACGQSDIEHLF